jgi:DNA-binding MarR family transcriptional regulator
MTTLTEPDHIDLHDLICFALHSTGSAMNRTYKPLLSKLGLTYPQYITLMVLWRKDMVSVGELCRELMTETSTLTPLLKRLEGLGHITRTRSAEDERRVVVKLTEQGRALQSRSPEVTRCVVGKTGMSDDQLSELVKAISTLRDNLVREL